MIRSFRHAPICLCICLLVCLITACSPQNNRTPQEEPKYFRLTDGENMRVLDVLNPWQEGALLGRYYLVSDSTTKVPSDGVRLQVPLSRLATSSATQMGFLEALGQTHCVVAMTTPQLIYNLPKQPVENIGDDMNIDLERLLLSMPDALLVSAYGQDMQNTERIRQAGIPVIYMVEWREENPLARMKWIRLLGALTGTDTQADSIVAAVRSAYHAEQALSQTLTTRRSIMSGASFRGTWYVPAGNTYMGQLFQDAGADYAYANRTNDGSIPLSMEQALQVFGKADVWVGCNAKSYNELQQIDDKQTWFAAYQHREVYNFCQRETPTGGNDFWETGVVHPEYILRDLRYALYPTSMPDYQPYFIHPLKE